jgi:hypothetical protein
MYIYSRAGLTWHYGVSVCMGLIISALALTGTILGKPSSLNNIIVGLCFTNIDRHKIWRPF